MFRGRLGVAWGAAPASQQAEANRKLPLRAHSGGGCLGFLTADHRLQMSRQSHLSRPWHKATHERKMCQASPSCGPPVPPLLLSGPILENNSPERTRPWGWHGHLAPVFFPLQPPCPRFKGTVTVTCAPSFSDITPKSRPFSDASLSFALSLSSHLCAR